MSASLKHFFLTKTESLFAGWIWYEWLLSQFSTNILRDYFSMFFSRVSKCSHISGTMFLYEQIFLTYLYSLLSLKHSRALFFLTDPSFCLKMIKYFYLSYAWMYWHYLDVKKTSFISYQNAMVLLYYKYILQHTKEMIALWEFGPEHYFCAQLSKKQKQTLKQEGWTTSVLKVICI